MKAALLALALIGCGASQRHHTIAATFAATNAASAQLPAYSQEHEANIVKTATTKEVAQAEIATFRAKVDKAEKVIDGVYQAIAAAAIADDDKSLQAMLQVALILGVDLKDLGMTMGASK